MFLVQQGMLTAFNAGTYLASVLLDTAHAITIDAVPVSRGIAAVEMVTGRRVAVALFDGANPDDAMVVGVY